MARYNNILETIGNTPLVRLNHLAPAGVNLYVKVEAFNPMGSVKDRMAMEMIEHAELSGQLQPGQTVIEATSGNTGIGLAMVCAQKGYPLVVTMAENFSVERRKLLRFLGARVVLTPAADKGTGMLAKAVELAETHGYYLCRQFENDANAEVHWRTTAVEILRDFQDETLHYWVSGFGTGGTLNGVARRLKQDSPATRIVVAEPDNSQLLGSGIPQAKGVDGRPGASHPEFRPHLMQGWSPDFISRLTERTIAENLVDEIVPVSGASALHLSRQLARREGIFAGISSGATLSAALQIAQSAAAGSNIVCMLPDTGERYLSTPLFADIGESMTDEEVALSQSTPNYRFDRSATMVPVARENNPPVTENTARHFVDRILREHPVVMFALEWCEFCWAVRKLFEHLGVPCYSVDLDSVALQQENLGAAIREVLAQRLGVVTIPQIFVAASHVGGCSELFAEYHNGKLGNRFNEIGINAGKTADFDASELLPKWIQPRNIAFQRSIGQPVTAE